MKCRHSGFAAIAILACVCGAFETEISIAQSDEKWSRSPGLELHVDESPRMLCDREDLELGVELSQSAMDSISLSYSDRNWAIIERADSLYRRGAFGEPDSDEARDQANLYFQIRSLHAIEQIAEIGSWKKTAWMGDAADFGFLLTDYMNVAMYPMRHIERARVGNGAFCIRYAIPKKYEHVYEFGDSEIRVRAEEVEFPDGRKRHLLARQWLAGDGKKLELLFDETFSGHVRRERIEDRGDDLDVVILHDFDGFHVRRRGTHVMSAMVAWRSVTEGDSMPENPRIGAVAYFPHIAVELPMFLPDIGLEDVRGFVYPPPLMDAVLFEEPKATFPEWMEVETNGQFKNWAALGPPPEFIDELFPDF